MTDSCTQVNPIQLDQLSDSIERYIAENFKNCVLDSDDTIQNISGNLAHWLLSQDNHTQSLLPIARARLALQIFDERSGSHIVSVDLTRTPSMTDDEFLHAQNTFWVLIGSSIRDNEQLTQQLRNVGVTVKV